MHAALPILGGQVLVVTGAHESRGFKLNQGNKVYINLEPDTRAETARLFAALSRHDAVGKGGPSAPRAANAAGHALPRAERTAHLKPINFRAILNSTATVRLSAGGNVEQALKEMFWGAYWGGLTDRIGIHWMFNCAAKAV